MFMNKYAQLTRLNEWGQIVEVAVHQQLRRQIAEHDRQHQTGEHSW